MQLTRARDFTASRAWGAKHLASLDGVTARLHWTDQPYHWHINDGDELFVVLDGVVRMHYRDAANLEQSVEMQPGDIFFATAGCAHVAHPQGAARILVLERAGSE
ncbi:cupin domain-containing protein [Vogesella oryzae]|uniref:cupin domain-containing protein n=1 Tax=Vogesella oryzae TaxID=1735285 RepID=UPI001582A3EE|nr:cupin domain-containing protein [Vogesella oryzae]